MNRDELKNYIMSLQLTEELQGVIFELIDSTPEVNDVLLDGISDIIELQAEFYDTEADLLDEEADEYDRLTDTLSQIDDEEMAERAEAYKKSQEQLLTEINQKLQELQTSTTDTNQMDAARQELQVLTNNSQQ